jgi:hypothetical protein
MQAGRSLAALGAAALFAAGAVVAISQVVAEYRAGPFAAAERLSRVHRPDAEAVDVMALEAAKAIVDGGSCAPQVIEPVGALLAERLDIVNEAVDYDAFVDTVSTAERFYGHAVACAPASSRAWTRLGLIDLVATGDLDRADGRVDVAGWNSPVFWPDLVQRIAYWKQRARRSDETHNPGLGRDVSTLLAHARPEDVVLAVEGASPEFLAQVAYQVTVLPPERIETLRSVGVGGPKPDDPEVESGEGDAEAAS